MIAISYKGRFVKYTFFTLSILLSISVIPASQSFADGIEDLQATLKQLNGNNPLSALVESSYTEKRGKKKKQKTKKGLIQVQLSDNHQGLKLIYSNETLTKLEQEATEKENNDEAETPTMNAVNGVGVAEMRNMLSAAPHLLRSLKKAKFENEELVQYQDKTVRQLNFTLPLAAIIDNKDVHEYVDDFSASYQLLIDESGVPLEGTTTFSGSGSAYIFFSMEITQTNKSTYKLVENRLINIKKTYQNKQSSTWGETESEGYKILIVQPDMQSIASIN